ncbi:hypothetical protein [Nocardia yunnanensis]|uniref:hypothetical protein n=1 Tax=Nocardia yunnanensis TaxID=2382165 RepID=UPI001FE9458E|nr:hypothetical protein [Nocardia yunnanensis]
MSQLRPWLHLQAAAVSIHQIRGQDAGQLVEACVGQRAPGDRPDVCQRRDRGLRVPAVDPESGAIDRGEIVKELLCVEYGMIGGESDDERRGQIVPTTCGGPAPRVGRGAHAEARLRDHLTGKYPAALSFSARRASVGE